MRRTNFGRSFSKTHNKSDNDLSSHAAVICRRRSDMGSLIGFGKDPCWVLVLISICGICVRGGIAATTDCSTVLVTSLPCLSYVQGNASFPASGCCRGLSSIAASNPICLCNLNSFADGIYINTTLAIQLPAVCNISVDIISFCSALSPQLSSSPTPESSAGVRSAAPLPLFQSPFLLSSPQPPSLARSSSDGLSSLRQFVFICCLYTTALLIGATIDLF